MSGASCADASIVVAVAVVAVVAGAAAAASAAGVVDFTLAHHRSVVRAHTKRTPTILERQEKKSRP